MGIVDEDRRAGRDRAGQIEPSARAAQICEHRQHGLAASPPVAMHRPAATKALDAWKAPTSGKPHFMLLARMLDDEVAGRSRSRLAETSRKRLAGASDDDERKPRAFASAATASPPSLSTSTTAAGAWRQQLAEQAELLREILLEARVIVQMVARDVGEGACRKHDAVDAALLQAVARRFERQMGDAVLGERSARIACSSIGSGVVWFERLGAARADDADRAEARGAEALLPVQSWRTKEATEVLPLVPVTATTVLGWRAEEARGDQRKATARILVLDDR